MRSPSPAAVGVTVALLCSLAGDRAAASTLRPLSVAELREGAELNVIAEVRSVSSRWAPGGRSLETLVVLATDDGAHPTLTIRQPGGELAGTKQVVLGLPTYRVGERARFHLRRNADGATWRVYGWWRGKWSALAIGDGRVYVPVAPGEAAVLPTNGMVWPAGAMPVRYLLNSAGSDDLALPEIATAVAAAFASWQSVPCSSLAFLSDGMTDLGVAIDGQNVISFVESGWIYGSEAAGATSLWIIDGEQTADIAMNGENYTWAIGPAGAAFNDGVIDLQGVLTHEFGHFSGLGHSLSSHDTMYYSWTPWVGQRTPSVDDKLTLCAIYPQPGDECAVAGDCRAGEACVPTASGRLCDGPADPIGAACNYDRIECGEFCLFTVGNLSDGYCSRFCEDDADCPASHHCAKASAGTMAVKVCFAGAPAGPDAGGDMGCAGDDNRCPDGQYCTALDACSLDCRSDDDCGGNAACDLRGRCQAATGEAGGCGCRGGGGGVGGGALALLLLTLAAASPRARRRRVVGGSRVR